MSHPCILFLFFPQLTQTSLDTVTFSIGPGLLAVLECHWVTSVFPSRPGNPYLELNPSQPRTIDLSLTLHVLNQQQATQTQTANTGLWLSYGINDDAVMLTENNEYLLDSCQTVFKGRILTQPMKLPYTFSYLSTVIWQSM